MLAGLQRNVRLFPWYRASVGAMAWLPVFFLYFSERVAFHEVVALEAVYYTTIVLLEVPSGYFSDRCGRRPTLLMSTGAIIGAYLVFLFAATFTGLLAGQVLIALAMTLRSGTDTALHYDSLAALDRTGEFARREALAERAGLTALAIAALLGGFAGWFDLRGAYLLSLLGAFAGAVLVWLFTEPLAYASRSAEATFWRQLTRCVRYLRLPTVLWLAGFFVVLDVLMHVPYEFYQPYLKLLEDDALAPDSSAPASGILLAAAMGLAAWVAGHSVALRDRIGLGGLLLAALALQLAIVAVISQWLSLATILIVSLRNIPNALAHAPFNAALGRHLATEHRATFLSMVNLAGRVGLGTLLGGVAWWLAPATATDWPTLQSVLRFFALIGTAAIVVLLLSAHALRRNGDTQPE